MTDPRIDERKRQVLRAVVLDYIATGEPVGSRTIARKYGLGVSPATIRNEMADLEDLGYLEQPHASAGRVPSDLGYRFFVDCLMDPAYPEPDEVLHVRRLLARRLGEVGGLLRQAAHVLAETTRCLALVEGPRPEAAALQALQLVPLGGQRAVLVVVTDNGMVAHRLVELPQEMAPEELARLARVLGDHLHGLPLGAVGRGVLARLQGELAGYRLLLDALLAALAGETAGEGFVYEGTAQIFSHPEFHDLRRVQALLEAVSRREALERLLGEPGDPGQVRITIGREHADPEARDWSTVTAVYTRHGRIVGRVAIIGPKRMDYGRVTGWVDMVTRNLSDLLDRAW